MAVAVQVDVSLLRLFELMEKRNVYTKEFALLIWNFKYHLSALMILHAWGGEYSLIWPLQGHFAGQGIVFGLCPKECIKFYASLSHGQTGSELVLNGVWLHDCHRRRSERFVCLTSLQIV